ncbi:MAG TPA: hypothetical protein VM578_07930 [Candidatus Saccharimonadales bacterium]|nr:hypothetical protein [Candidatus Saccharimonadales bacterium]
MWRARIAMLVAALMLVTGIGAVAQDRGRFYDGVRQGGHGGRYDRGHDHGWYDERNRRYDYDRGRYDRDRGGGIGPGTGAVIGGAGGAVLGGLLGGGLKGSLIGGAAGAGIGAIAGQANQNHRDDRYRR